MRELTDADLDKTVAVGSADAFVLFGASWCRASAASMPLVATAAREGVRQVFNASVDLCPDAAARAALRCIPCLVRYRDGHQVSRLEGARRPGEYSEWLNGSG